MDLRIALAGNPNSGKTSLFNAISGGLLVLIGILMATGTLGRALALLS